MNKHGIWLKPEPIELIVEQALQRRYTHIWNFANIAREDIPTSFGAYSIQINERHKKVATVSVWKRGAGHVDIIFVKNTAWADSTFRDVTPAQLLDAVNYMERVLGITISGSPGGTGWNLLKKIHPEWIEDVHSNLKDLHFTPKAGNDLSWQHSEMRAGRGLPRPGKYVHKFDRRGAFPYASTQTDIGTGTPVHIDHGEDARHEKGHPQGVGVWRCSIEYNPLMYDSNMPPIWGEEAGTHAGSEGWLAGPIIRLLRDTGHTVHVHEGWVFPERHDLLTKWAKFLYQKREEATNEIARKGFKQIPNTTIGFTAFRHFEDDEEEKRRPDIRLQVVTRQRELFVHNIRKIKELYGQKPIMCYTDAAYYLSDEPILTFPYFQKRESEFGGMRYEGSIELTPEVQAMFAQKMLLVDRLEFLNKIGWTK